MAKTANAITMARVLLHTPAEGALSIGWLSEVGDNLRVSFDDWYVQDPERPTLSQLYRGQTDVETRAILTAIDDERLVRIRALPVYFSNLLPEGPNRERLARERNCSVDDELDLISAAGHDLSGAVEIVPGHDVPANVLELHGTKHLEPLEANAVAAPVEDGFSVDGVQTKFSMVSEGQRYVVRRGTNAGAFIAKLPSSKFRDLALNEFSGYQLARAIGIETANASIRPISEFGGPPAVADNFEEFLLVDRFDRKFGEDGKVQRVHFEELTQALGLEARHKYKNLQGSMLALLLTLKASPITKVSDFDEFFRRWTAYALMGNTDAHAKNWGFIYRDGINAQLAPAYDLVCVAAYFDEAGVNFLGHNRAMDTSLRKWDEDQAEILAKRAGLTTFNRARKVVRDTRKMAAALWPALLKESPPRMRDTVTSRLAELAPETKRPSA